jgi:formylmethanofuran dehydrogenase subunit E
MLRTVVMSCLFVFPAICFSQEVIPNLPTPTYHPAASDPAWLKHAVQLHGHLGPMLSFGTRMGMAALHAVDAKGYFDVEITCEGPFVKPPESCFLDGIQISTGATLGKRNLQWIDGKKIVVRIKNTTTGKTAEVKPTDQFLALLPQPNADKKNDPNANHKSQPGDDHDYDDLTRKMAVMPEKDILTVSYPKQQD